MSPVKDVFTKCAYLFFHCTMGEKDKKHFRLCKINIFFKTLDYPDKNFLRHKEKGQEGAERRGKEREEALTQLIYLTGEESWDMFQSS